MSRSVRKIVKGIVYRVIRCCSSSNKIVFESAPDFSDNTMAVFDEMLRRGIDQKYSMVWLVSDKTKRLPGRTSVQYIWLGNWFDRLRAMFFLVPAKCLICCNRFLTPLTDEQISFYLAHGTPIKSVRSYYTMPPKIQYCLSAAPGVEKMTAYQFNADESKMFSLGYPRNDVFAKKPMNVKGTLQTDCEKVIVWYPTFRQHINGRKAGAPKALPIIHDAESAQKLNACARENGVLIVVKPHFAQDLREIKDQKLSNIRFIDDSFFTEHRITSYEFVGGCDALLTDYSSIYYDYTLCDKPIGVVWEDVEEYRKNPGFAVDLDKYLMGAEKIYTLKELERFVLDVSRDHDRLAEARRKIRDLTNYSTDGQNAKRVVDFIVEKAKL